MDSVETLSDLNVATPLLHKHHFLHHALGRKSLYMIWHCSMVPRNVERKVRVRSSVSGNL